MAHGNMSLSQEPRSVVLPRREAFLRELGFDLPSAQMPHVVAPVMSHSDEIRTVPHEGVWLAPDCDVLVTQGPSVLVQAIADCLGLVIVDPVTRTIALAHAGYQGVGLDVPTKTVRYLERRFGVNPSDLLVAMGPSWQGSDGEGAWMDTRGPRLDSPRWNPYIRETGGGIVLRWVDRAYDQLVAAGVLRERIERCPIDTYSGSDFFSHHRWVGWGKEGIDGRHLVAVGIV
ncbi:MAG TPA: laccase domain-containing protein [Patescibacteria group bacterium]